MSVIEEGILNPKFEGYRSGRIEVWSDDSRYSICEYRFLIPDRFFSILECLDFQEFTEKEIKNFMIDINPEKLCV